MSRGIQRRGVGPAILIVALLSMPAAAAPADPETLAQALARLQERGLPLIYSSDLVRPGMRVAREPRSHDPRGQLEELLAPHGLTAEDGPRGSLLIVRAAAPPSGPAKHPDAAEPRLDAETARFRETVEVKDQAPPETGLSSSVDVRPLDVMAVAGAVENVHRTIQMFPGVAGVNELEGRVAVRGGGPDQNLTMMDGVEVHNPYRLFGLASAFNPDTVEKFELVTGAFHPRYGDRLSSILVVDTRVGSRARGFSGAAALSLTDTNAIFEGRLPGPGEGSWLLTGRRTYYDLVLGSTADGTLPSFSDLQLKTAWDLGRGRRLSLVALHSREKSNLEFNRADEYSTRAGNQILSTRLVTPIGTRGMSNTAASWSRNHDEMGLRDTSPSSRGRGNGDARPFDWVDIVVGRDVRVRDLALRQELGYQASSRHLLGAGFDLHSIVTGLAWRMSAGDRDDLLRQGPSTRPDGPGTVDDAPFPARFRGGFWVHDRFQYSPRLTLEGGLRLDRGGITPRLTLSPRASARFRIDGTTTVALAAGKHAQSTGYEKFLQRNFLFNGSSLFDLTDLPPGGLRPERAFHLVASAERRLPWLDARLEAYYKKFDDLIIGDLESEEAWRARLAQYDYPAELQGRIATERQITRHPTNGGRGYAYGLELLLSRRSADPEARLGGWIAYSFGVARRQEYGTWHPFAYDRPHSVSLVGSYRPSRGLELSATARIASGFPWKVPVGVHVPAVPDTEDRDQDGNRTELVPARTTLFGEPFVLANETTAPYVYEPYFGGFNNRAGLRGPAYKRVDLRASFHPRWWGGRWTVYVDVINALGRHNRLAPFYLAERDENGTVQTRDDTESGPGLPRLPSLGIRVRF